MTSPECPMNIFFLDRSPKIAARMHCDRHVVKMPIESAQMLSDAHRVLDGSDHPMLCDKYNPNHKCSLWVQRSRSNYLWLYSLFEALCDEYEFRYGRKHESLARSSVLSTPLTCIPDIGLTEPELAMPEFCRLGDAVSSYRLYYLVDKMKFARWTRRSPPLWWPDRTIHPDKLRQKRLKDKPRRTISFRRLT